MFKGSELSFAPFRQHVRAAFSGLSWITKANWIFLFTMTVTWVLFQKKMLPKPMSKVVSKVFFLPTFPITALMRMGNYWTKVDDTLILGCAPMNILGHPNELYKLGVRGVVNMCYEYPGPISSYDNLGIKQLYLPTVDHYEPSLEYMVKAVRFIQEHQERGEKVYVHCKAAHGRAASIALCWMLKQHPGKTAKVSFTASFRTSAIFHGRLFL
jgi:atypical dual specificity phosphatase